MSALLHYRVRRFGLTETIRVGQVGAIRTVNTSDVRDLPCPKGTTSPALSAHLVLPNGHNWRSSVARTPQCVISDTVCHSQHSGLEVRKSHLKGGKQSGAETGNAHKKARPWHYLGNACALLKTTLTYPQKQVECDCRARDVLGPRQDARDALRAANEHSHLHTWRHR